MKVPELTYYRKLGEQGMYPWSEGCPMDDVSVGDGDTPEVGGMIAVNPDDPSDKWYIAKKFFNTYYTVAR